MAKTIQVITGPTSSGKTALALEFCKKNNGEIISADSRQIYKYMDVGTGKLPIDKTANEVEKFDKYWIVDGIKIWMYDVVNPGEYYSVKDYKFDCIKIINDVLSRKKTPIIVGGTGLYLDAILGKKTDFNVSANWDLRKILDRKSVIDLQKMIDPKILDKMNNSDKNNPRRLIRKIEIAQKAKLPFQLDDVSSKYEFSVEVINLSRKELYHRVDIWVDKIWDPLIAETLRLIDFGYSDAPTLNGIIYKTAKNFIKGDIKKNTAIERIKFDLHAYIRRQETWFNKY